MSRPVDPEIAAAAGELGRLLLGGPSAAEVEAELRGAMQHARSIGGPTGELAGSLLGVLDVVHQWNLRAGADRHATLTYEAARKAIMEAVERGLAGGN